MVIISDALSKLLDDYVFLSFRCNRSLHKKKIKNLFVLSILTRNLIIKYFRSIFLIKNKTIRNIHPQKEKKRREQKYAAK